MDGLFGNGVGHGEDSNLPTEFDTGHDDWRHLASRRPSSFSKVSAACSCRVSLVSDVTPAPTGLKLLLDSLSRPTLRPAREAVLASRQDRREAGESYTNYFSSSEK